MIFGVPQKSGNFLISCPHISFSRRAILNGFVNGNVYGGNDNDEYYDDDDDDDDDTLLFGRKISASFNIVYIMLNLLSQTAYPF
jgi:hypothetical protein